MLVPEMVLVLPLLVCQAEVMLLPGAKISTQLPQLEKDDRASLLVVDPTVMASEAEAGDRVQASVFSLPAATTNGMSDATAVLTAVLTRSYLPPPRDMLATHLLVSPEAILAPQSVTTHSIPSMTPENVPEPLQPRTFTATRLAFLATPYVVPPTVPATGM